MSCDMFAEYEEEKRIAHNAHMCCECREKILRGQEYMKCSGKFRDEEWQIFRQHMNCWTFCREVVNQDECEVGFGCVFDEIYEFPPNIQRKWKKIWELNALLASQAAGQGPTTSAAKEGGRE